MTKQALVIGLTGNIATGKSTVLAYFASKGAHVVDADKLAHQAMAPGGPAYGPIVERFGMAILQGDGQIDRKALGQIVFADAAALRQLEAISHPAVYRLAEDEIEQADAPIVIIEAIKLLDGGRTQLLCDEIWVVTSSEEMQLKRLRETRGMDEAEARRRMAAQSSQAEKVRQADRVISNDGSEEELQDQLAQIWQEIQLY